MLADRGDALREALRRAADRRAAADAAREAVLAEAARAGFADLDAAAAAVLEEAALAGLDAACREYDRRDAATAAALADPDLAGVELAAVVDTAPAEAALAAAKDEHTERAGSARAAAAAHREVVRLASALAAAVAEAEPVRRRSAQVVALADLVSGQGQNARRMTLRAYVLAARLDEVARSASERLRRMSGGRYSFVATGESDTRRVRAGLGLQILDDYSGHTARPGRCPAARASWRRCRSRSDWPTWSPPKPAGRSWRPSSSTRGSAAWTPTRSTSSWTPSMTSAPAAG
jgi:exonuclease SbcC